MARDQEGAARYGLLGFPVGHSYSGSMHNAAFAHLGIAAHYELFEVSPEKLEEFFSSTVKERGLRGFNVTVPHKEAAVRYLNGSISPAVRQIGAVNTIRIEADGTRSGCNTDAPGFRRDLRENGVEVAGKKAVLIGAGGAAKAVAAALGGLKVRELEIFDVAADKAVSLAEKTRQQYPYVDARAVTEVRFLDTRAAALLVNATPVGMKPSEPPVIGAEQLHPGLFVYDLIYNPARTPLLAAAEKAGCRRANGLGMLLYQGCRAFEYWTGKEAPVEVMRAALRRHVYGE
ncbi:MAG: shikimate dehydrogenase [Deltaproteobacteria bacterium]